MTVSVLIKHNDNTKYKLAVRYWNHKIDGSASAEPEPAAVLSSQEEFVATLWKGRSFQVEEVD
jgi:hypothetical protein